MQQPRLNRGERKPWCQLECVYEGLKLRKRGRIEEPIYEAERSIVPIIENPGNVAWEINVLN